MKIETTDIYRSLRLLLEKKFQDIKVQIKDVKNPHPPCLYIKFISGTNTQTATEYENNTCSFDIIYFSEQEKLQDLLSIEKELKKIFKYPLKIELMDKEKTTCYQEIDSISTNLNEDDYILNCTISLSVDQVNTEADPNSTDFENRYGEYDNEEFMEELELEI